MDFLSRKFQWFIKVIFSYVVFIVVMLVNFGLINDIELFSYDYWHNVFDVLT